MGVSKLWQLLLTIAQPCQLEQLNGKVLAIDASIWIVKIDTSFSSNAQKIKSLLSKIMLLKRNNILPLFVFDGVAPALKRRTLEERSRKRIVTNDQQAKKKSQIEIMRLIQGDSSSRINKHNEKSKKIHNNQAELNVVNDQLKKLSDFVDKGEGEVTQQWLQKIEMQSQILNTKYKLMLDLLPQYATYSHFIRPQQFQDLDLELKQEYLDQLEQFKWKQLKYTRKNNRGNLTQQQKLRNDLEIIEKKSVIREMKHQLFRKLVQKNVKIQNGFQIIQTIYNGKPVVQRRKINEKKSQIQMGPFRKDKMKNNMDNISFGEEVEEGEAQGDPFIASFCSHDLGTLTISQPQSWSDKWTQKLGKVKKDKARATKKREQKQLQSNNEQSSEQLVPFLKRQRQQRLQDFVNKQQFNQDLPYSRPESLNVDNIPNFEANHSQYLNNSQDNQQLQNLFTIIGIPFLVAPGQAEAQCASLEQQGIVDGIITQDSDVFLFGGKNVYRGVFGNSIRHYSFDKMQQKLKMTREKLIIFAELLGSDYSEGVKGIGLVNAMEILKVFNTFEKIQQFKNWAEHPDVLLDEHQTTSQRLESASKEEAQFYQLHKRFKNYWYVNPSLGSTIIHQAYLQPDVLTHIQLKSMENRGDLKEKPCRQELLSRLLKQRMELDGKEYDHYTKLLTLRFNNKRPKTILNYFSRQTSEVELAKIKSKRLQKSLSSSLVQKQ